MLEQTTINEDYKAKAALYSRVNEEWNNTATNSNFFKFSLENSSASKNNGKLSITVVFH